MNKLNDKTTLTTINNILKLIENDSISNSDGIVWLVKNFTHEIKSGVIGPDVYSGMAGMALTFSAFYKINGNKHIRQIACQCILHSLNNADKISENYRHGFYNGWSGIIYTAILTYKILNHDEILLKALKLMKKLSQEKFSSEYDLMSGISGTVSGLTLASPVLGKPALELAIKAAEALKATAIIQKKTNSIYWKTSSSNNLALTGFSHGNAGVGWALFELWSISQIDWIYELACDALKYENNYYDSENKNWYDLRYYYSNRTIKKMSPKSEIAWCHGAGGIALSRLRAFELTKNQFYLDEIKIAAETLIGNIKSSNLTNLISTCLCHSATGNLDILLTIKRRLSHKLDLDFINPILNIHLESYNQTISPQNIEPGLMLGTSGLAYYLMRLIDNTLISPLLPELIEVK